MTEVLIEWASESARFQIITKGIFAVDTFFLLSGLLTSYSFLKEANKAKRIKISFMIKYYVHRYWRY